MRLHPTLFAAALALSAGCASSAAVPTPGSASPPEALPSNVAEPGPEPELPPECREPIDAGGSEVLWAARIGITTYKSTLLFDGDRIVVASNGLDRKRADDPCDGVYILDAATGEVRRFIPMPGEGERDANGVALDGDALYVGTDQGVLYKLDRRGEVIWKRSFDGDVEAAPVLADVNRDRILDVAVGVEGGNFYVLDGESGEQLYEQATQRGDYDQTGFLATAAAADVNGDGYADVFAAGRDYVMRAIDGKSGALLWQHREKSALHSAPVLVDPDGDGALDLVYAEAYSGIHAVDARTGRPKWSVSLTHPGGGIEGLFAPLTWHPDLGCALIGTAWWGEREGLYCAGPGGVTWRFTVAKKNITSGAVVGDIDGRHGAEVVFGTEAGRVVGLNAAGQPVWGFEAGAPIECAPTLADVDGDGHTEVLVASTDGVLRALKTEGKDKPRLGYYRGNATNAGVMP